MHRSIPAAASRVPGGPIPAKTAAGSSGSPAVLGGADLPPSFDLLPSFDRRPLLKGLALERDLLLQYLREAREFFARSTDCLDPADATVAPVEGMMTAAQQIAHVAATVDWFREGAFGPDGFDMDFEGHMAKLNEITTLDAAREWLDRAFDQITTLFAEASMEELSAPVEDDTIMTGEPRYNIVMGVVDHTAHHRGALTVYSRLAGRTPAMPYM